MEQLWRVANNQMKAAWQGSIPCQAISIIINFKADI